MTNFAEKARNGRLNALEYRTRPLVLGRESLLVFASQRGKAAGRGVF